MIGIEERHAHLNDCNVISFVTESEKLPMCLVCKHNSILLMQIAFPKGRMLALCQVSDFIGSLYVVRHTSKSSFLYFKANRHCLRSFA